MEDRVIFHIDLDSFFASVVELKNPELKGKPVVVCVYSGRTKDSGIVSTANYKARELGIRSGVPIKRAKKLGNEETIFLPVDMQFYKKVSKRIMDLLEAHADRFQQVSIDEAYLDVTERTKNDLRLAESLGYEIKRAIQDTEGLTCSIGIAPNKFVAKMASNFQKPDGLTIIPQEKVIDFISGFRIEELHGIGRKTSASLIELGVTTVEELRNGDLKLLESRFGKNKALDLLGKASGIDKSPVKPESIKQISKIGTLKEDTDDFGTVFDYIDGLIEELIHRVRELKIQFRTISLIIIDTSLKMETKSQTVPLTEDPQVIRVILKKLLKDYLKNPKKIRRVGVKISNFANLKGKNGKTFPTKSSTSRPVSKRKQSSFSDFE